MRIKYLILASWFSLSTFLSHQPGESTARTSRGLARRIRGVFHSHRCGSEAEHDDVESLNGHLRSAAHFVIFFILTILSFWCFGFLGVAGAVVWAVLDEVSKIPVPGRHYSFKDVMKNMVGVCLGVLLLIVSMNMVGGAAVPTTEVQRQQITTAENAVFAWDGVVESDLKLLEKHSIGIVLLDINHTDSIRLLSDYTVLILCGDPAWTVEDYSSAITTAKGLNASGIVFDIENDYNAWLTTWHSYTQIITSLTSLFMPAFPSGLMKQSQEQSSGSWHPQRALL